MKNKIRWITGVTAALLIVANVQGAMADDVWKNINAWFGSISIIYNSQTLTGEAKSFIIDGTTYVPLRSLATLMNKEINWNAENATISLLDKPDAKIDALNKQIADKDYQITQLQQQLQEAGSTKSQTTITNDSLSKLENQLNNDFGNYKNIQFDIQLSGNRNSIAVKINIDLDRYRYEWRQLNARQQKDFLQEVSDEIRSTWSGVGIDGYIRDTYEGSRLLDFTVSSGGSVSIEQNGTTTSLKSLENDVESKYYDYFKNIKLTFQLDGNSDDITYTVELDYSRYEEEWDDLNEASIRGLMSLIYDFIERQYDDATIKGYVENTDGGKILVKYYKNSSGEFKFYRN